MYLMHMCNVTRKETTSVAENFHWTKLLPATLAYICWNIMFTQKRARNSQDRNITNEGMRRYWWNFFLLLKISDLVVFWSYMYIYVYVYSSTAINIDVNGSMVL